MNRPSLPALILSLACLALTAAYFGLLLYIARHLS